MSDLVCLAFKELDTADHFLNELRKGEEHDHAEINPVAVSLPNYGDSRWLRVQH